MKIRVEKKEKVPKENYFSTLTTEDFYILLFGNNLIPPQAGFFDAKRVVGLDPDLIIGVNSK